MRYTRFLAGTLFALCLLWLCSMPVLASSGNNVTDSSTNHVNQAINMMALNTTPTYIPTPKIVSNATTKDTSSMSVVGKPTISTKGVDALLCNNGSPMCGEGKYFVQYSEQYSIDDALLLAIYQHESTWGKNGIAVSTRSVCNTRPRSGYPVYRDALNGNYALYPDWITALSDCYNLLYYGYVRNGLGRGYLTTVDAIFPVFAPTGDGNDTAGYIQAVKTKIHVWRGY